MKKWLIKGLGQKTHKMKLQHLLVPASKKVLRKQMMGTCQRLTGASLKELPVANTGTI